jgi:hypothetical protein
MWKTQTANWVNCRIFSTLQQLVIIQGDSGGNVDILGIDSMGHCEKKKIYEGVSNTEWLPR